MAEKKAEPRFWTRLRRRRVRRTLVAGGMLLLLVVGWQGLQRLRAPDFLPLRKVVVRGDFHHLDRAAVQRNVDKVARGGFFSIDVQRVKTMAERVPWVDRAVVRRVWPDRLVIEVTEQVPFARWGEGALVNPRGVVFRPHRRSFPRRPLPRLSGPDALAPEAVRLYREMSRALAHIGLGIEEMQVNRRQTWRLRLNNGLRLVLSRDEPLRRLARFAQVYPRLGDPALGEMVEVDLRYSNGIAVRRKPPADAPATGEGSGPGAAGGTAAGFRRHGLNG